MFNAWNRGGRKFVSATRQPRKQRKLMYNLPLHLRQKQVSAPLSPELREKMKTRSVSLHMGDAVKVTRGKYAGVSGKVVRVELKSGRVFVDTAVVRKAKGREELFPLVPSILLVTELASRKGTPVKVVPSAAKAEKKAEAKDAKSDEKPKAEKAEEKAAAKADKPLSAPSPKAAEAPQKVR